MDVEVPRRAAYLRIIWSELHRMHSHLLWLGLFADALGFESLFMQFWKIRERIMDINEATAGNRVIISTNIGRRACARISPVSTSAGSSTKWIPLKPKCAASKR